MPTLPVSTRWRSLAEPVSPYDPIQADAPRYEAGKLPVGFVIMCWDGTTLLGPYRFENEADATARLMANPDISHFLIVPNPNEVYEIPTIPGLS